MKKVKMKRCNPKELYLCNDMKNMFLEMRSVQHGYESRVLSLYEFDTSEWSHVIEKERSGFRSMSSICHFPANFPPLVIVSSQFSES